MALRSSLVPRPLAVVVVLVLAASRLVAQYPPVSPDLGTDQRLNTNLPGIGSAVLPQTVVTEDGTLHVVWQDFRANSWQIYYRRITNLDPGTSSVERRISTFAAPEPLVNHVDPRIATDGDQGLYVTWHGTSNAGEHVFFNRSQDGGMSWELIDATPAHQLNAAITTEYAGAPQIAADRSGNVHVTWSQSDLLFDQIYVTSSLDAGSTWTNLDLLQPLNLETLGHRESPRVAADEQGRVYVAWLDHRIPALRNVFIRRSLDGGLSWQRGEQRISAPGTADDLHLLAQGDGLSTHQGLVLATWIDIAEDADGGPVTALHSNVSYDAGASFRMRPLHVVHDCPELDGDAYESLGSGPPLIDGGQGHTVHCNPLYLGLDVDQRSDGMVYAVYGRVDPPLLFEPTRVLVSRFDPQLGVWTTEREVSRKGSLFPLKGLIPSQPRPSIAAGDAAIWAAWMHTGNLFTDASDVNVAWSDDGGLTWSNPSGATTKPAGPGTSGSANPVVVEVGGKGVIIWDDRRAWTDHATIPLPPGSPLGAPHVYLNIADPQQLP